MVSREARGQSARLTVRLTCRPPGRGNWKIITITIEGIPYDLLRLRAGQRLELPGLGGGTALRLRIVSVSP